MSMQISQNGTKLIRRWSGITPLLIAACLFCPAAPAQEQPVEAPRYTAEIARFEEQDRADSLAPGHVLFVGSSSVRLWKLKQSFPTLDALNRGFGGSKIPDSVFYFPRIVAPRKPRQVVFYAGDNDIAAGHSPQTVHEDFQKFVALMHQQLPGTPLAYISIKPSLKRWKLIETIREANALIKADCDKDPLLTYVDVDTPMLNEAGTPRPELFVEDGLHMTPAGYAVWTAALKPHLLPDQRASKLRTIYDAYHPWTPPTTLPEWEKQSQRLREQVLVACGLWPMPPKAELNPVIHGAIDRGDYTVERVYFQSAPGLYVTGSLYRPQHTIGKIPAVLCPHGHWANGRFVDTPPAEAEKLLNSGAEQYMSGARFPLQARMVQLARMGCVVFHYDMIGVADNGPLPHRGGFADADSALWLHNRLGLQTWNSIRALDFVSALPDVDPSRIGVTGASGGGTQTFLLAAVDPRITVAFPAVMVSTAMQGGCICENADHLRTGINNIAIAALMAPRPQAMSGAADWTREIETKGLPELRQVYALTGNADLVTAQAFPQFPHNYNQVAREMMFDWFNIHLHLGLPSPVRQTDFWPLTTEEMTVFDAAHPRPADALEEPALRAQLRERDQKIWSDLLAGDPSQLQTVLKGASRVLLPPVESPVSTESATPESATPETIDATSASPPVAPALPLEELVVTYDKARVPVSIIRPQGMPDTQRVVLWIDTQLRTDLHQPSATFPPTVQQLLNSGTTVAVADLFLTGEESGSKDLYSKRFETTSPGHAGNEIDKEYTGFVYGYNLTLLAQRVRDIQAVVRALADRGFSRISLVGTGEAGLWTLLARANLPPDAVVNTVVDLQGFSFNQVKTNSDPRMLPGALKYGGVGGLAALAFPSRLTIFGVAADQPAEFATLKKVYESHPDQLSISAAALTPEEILKQLPKP